MGRLVRTPSAAESGTLSLDGHERATLEAFKASAGYRFTAAVQRSWCVGRLDRAASFTLSVVPADLRARLLHAWVDAGGGTSSFFASESEAFLSFIAKNLPDPSHELTACRLERATLRANEHAQSFTPPDLSRLAPACRIARGSFADLVVFHGEPRDIIESLLKHRHLPISRTGTALLFAPGIEGLQRIATPAQQSVWERLATPLPLGVLLEEGYDRTEVGQMLRWSCLDWAVPPAPDSALPSNA